MYFSSTVQLSLGGDSMDDNKVGREAEAQSEWLERWKACRIREKLREASVKRKW